jgi:Coenzyme PQQ synthesis protein D (PqqD)
VAEALRPLREAAIAATTLRPRRRGTVLSYDAGEELLVYHPGSEAAVSLNLTAAAIWELCDGGRSVSEIVGALWSACGEDASVIDADVRRVIAELHALNLVLLAEADGVEERGERW